MLKKLARSSIILFIQIFSTFIMLFVVYMVFAFLDNVEADFISVGALLILQPIYAILISGISIVLCLISGLPIRFNTRINSWWKSKPLIPVISFILGFILLIISFVPNFNDHTSIIIDGQKIIHTIPNSFLAITGWLSITFSMLHFYPFAFTNWLKNRLLKNTWQSISLNMLCK